MTEAEWLICADPELMLKFLTGKDSNRKLRLFAVGCCRRIQGLMRDPGSQRMLEVAERLADRLAAKHELAWCSLAEGKFQSYWDGKSEPAAEAALHALARDARGAALGSGRKAATAVALQKMGRSQWSMYNGPPPSNGAERYRQCDLLRDLFGNPFESISLNPNWLWWNDGTVVKIAQAIYDDRRFEDLPILADALEDAGCDNADILAHCRQPGEHVRGCWVVDLLLGKE